VERFDIQEKKWESVVDLPILASAVHAFVLFDRLYCIAFSSVKVFPMDEHEKEVKIEGFYEYDVLQNHWNDAVNSFSTETLGSLYECLIKNGSIAVCSNSNKIFAVTNDTVTCLQAGLDDGDVICKEKGNVMKLESVTEDYANFVAVILDKNLYVLGGYLLQNNPATNRVCMYSCEKTWMNKCKMLEPRANFDAVVLGKCIQN